MDYANPISAFLERRRQAKHKADFDAHILSLTMGVVNALKAGMAFPQALDRVGEQIGGAMGEEVAATLREYRLGMDIADAVQRLHDRMPSEDMRLIASAVKLSISTGGSLVEVMAKLVDTIRDRTEFQQKLATLTAQGRFEAIAMSCCPLVAFVLMYIIQPDLMRPLLTTLKGWCAIGTSLTLVTLGYLTIRKIVDIKV